MKTILLKFAAPLQSWGTSSYFESRQTDLHPSKSGVLGLLAGSLGYRREDDEKIRALNDLDFGLRVDQGGRLLRDYQIAGKYKAKTGAFEKNYVTNRYYLEDAIFLVGLSHENDQWMEDLFHALKNPYFQPFLGRRSTPPNYDFILGLVDQPLVEALKEYPWQARPGYKRTMRDFHHLSIYVESHLVDSQDTKFRRDAIRSLSQKNRQFTYRKEARITVLAIDQDMNTDHDPMAYLGGAHVPIKS